MKKIELIFFLLVSLSSPILFAQDIFSEPNNSVLPAKGICAHRGAMETHPENTIAAFEEAIRLGAQMIEFDVQLTKDNKPVVIHDHTVDRTTNGSGLVHKLTLAEIRTLDAGSWKSKKFTGEKVPTLKEVLQIMPKNIWLNIHLKGNKKLGVETAKLIVSEKRLHQAVVACEKKAAKGVGQINEAIYICNMRRLSSRSKYINETIKKQYPFIQLKKSRNDNSLKSDIEHLKQNKVSINYVQADSPKEIDELLDLGVNFIFTDHLTSMLKAFEQAQASRRESW